MNKIKLFSLSLSYFLVSTILVSGVSLNDISAILIYNTNPSFEKWGFKRFSIKAEDESIQKKSTADSDFDEWGFKRFLVKTNHKVTKQKSNSNERKEEVSELSTEFVFADNEQVQFTELRNIIWEVVNKHGREGSEGVVNVIFRDDFGDLLMYGMSITGYFDLVDTLNKKLYLSGNQDVKQLRVLMRFNMNCMAIPKDRTFIDM